MLDTKMLLSVSYKCCLRQVPRYTLPPWSYTCSALGNTRNFLRTFPYIIGVGSNFIFWWGGGANVIYTAITAICAACMNNY